MTLERPNPLITYSKGTLMMHDGDDNIDDHNAMMMMMMVLIMMIMTLWIAHLSRLGIVNLKQTNCFETALPHFVEEYGSGERYHRNWIWSQSGDPGNSNSNYLVLPGHYNLYYQLSFWFHKLSGYHQPSFLWILLVFSNGFRPYWRYFCLSKEFISNFHHLPYRENATVNW